MKKLLTIIIFSFIAFSCKKDELVKYSENPIIYLNLNKVQFYGPRPGSFAGKLMVNVGYRPGNIVTDTIRMPVYTSGLAASENRPYIFSRITEAGQAVENTDFEFLNQQFLIAAGRYDSIITIVAFRTPALMGKSTGFGYTLQANENFDLGIQADTASFASNSATNTMRQSGLRIVIADIVEKPANWDTFIANYFGVYSEVKYRFIIDALKVSLFPNNTSGGTMRSNRTKLRTALTTYNATHPEPLKDENGQLVTF